MTERQAYIAFNLTDKVGPATLEKLIGQYGSAVAAWEAYPNKISRTGGEVDWEQEERLATKFGVKVLTAVDVEYPKRLLDSPGHPIVLYVKGDPAVLAKPSLAMVGTRRATNYGRDIAGRMAFDLASAGWAVISGLALGIDAASHQGALDAKGITIGVLGSGLDRFYPEENRELAREIVKNGGAVISQFPFGRSADTTTFPIRNHVVAALATALIAVECPLKSGTLITAGIAADLGREVMAVPGRTTDRMSAGTNGLIRDGATLVRNADDVLEIVSVYGVGAKTPDGKESGQGSGRDPEKPPFTVEEALVMTELTEDGITIDEIVRQTKLSVTKVNSVAMELRLKGFARFLPGNRISLLTSSH